MSHTVTSTSSAETGERESERWDKEIGLILHTHTHTDCYGQAVTLVGRDCPTVSADKDEGILSVPEHPFLLGGRFSPPPLSSRVWMHNDAERLKAH